MLGRTPYYVLTGGLAIIFLFPLLWSVVASVSPQAATGQVIGYGFGNYTTLYNYGAGLAAVPVQQHLRGGPHGGDHAGGVDARRLRLRAIQVSRDETCCSC